jgi:hypothetical protein
MEIHFINSTNEEITTDREHMEKSNRTGEDMWLKIT